MDGKSLKHMAKNKLKTFKATVKYKDVFGKDISRLVVRPLDHLEIGNDKSVWFAVAATDGNNMPHDSLMLINKDTAKRLAKYFKELSKELK